MNVGEVLSLILTALAGGMNIVVACLLSRRAKRLEEWERELVEMALGLACARNVEEKDDEGQDCD